MPDHVHILLFVLQHMRDPLGNVIARFKQAINQACDTVGIFNVGFNDQILKSGRSLDTLYRYIRENPRRLAARRQFPEYFRRVNDMVIAGHKCKLYGNMLLLRNPFKEQVVVHRADSQAVCAANHARWIYTAAITITNRPMEERYKPAGARLRAMRSRPVADRIARQPRYRPHPSHLHGHEQPCRGNLHCGINDYA